MTNDIGFSSKLYPTRYKMVFDPDIPPLYQHPFNDEFDDGYLDRSWSVSNAWEEPGSAGVRISNGRIWREIPTSGNFTAWTKLSASGQPGMEQYLYIGMFAQVGTGVVHSGELTMFTNYTKLEGVIWSSWFAWSSTPITWGNIWTNACYLSTKRSGNDISFWYSTDGLAYYRFYNVTLANVSRVGIFCMATSNCSAWFQFFRYLPEYIGQGTLLGGRSRKKFYE